MVLGRGPGAERRAGIADVADDAVAAAALTFASAAATASYAAAAQPGEQANGHPRVRATQYQDSAINYADYGAPR